MEDEDATDHHDEMKSSQAEAVMTCSTRISNPGIADRLAKDVSSFPASLGFEFRKDDDDNGVFVASQRCADNNSTIVMPPAVASLQIYVADASLVNSVGPFLRTLVRLCVNPIDPRSLQVIVLIGNCKMKTQKNDDNDNCDASSRFIAHEIHMMIRNSMMAALFLLNLHVVLPRGTSRVKVLEKMKDNDDGCYEYPSVHLHDSDGDPNQWKGNNKRQPFEIDLGLVQESTKAPPKVDKPISPDCLKNGCFDPDKHYIALDVTTRMCTVRLTPILYQLSQRLLGNVVTTTSLLELHAAKETSNHHEENLPLIVICLEKPANLYRILMLVRDYGGISSIGKQLLLVCDSNSVNRFDAAAQKFVVQSFLNITEEGKIINRGNCFPKVVSIEDTPKYLSSVASVVGIDLHEDAKTLRGNANEALQILSSAGAIVFGFESDGIPPAIHQMVSQYVQAESRTSINIVAAISIFLHVLPHWSR